MKKTILLMLMLLSIKGLAQQFFINAGFDPKMLVVGAYPEREDKAKGLDFIDRDLIKKKMDEMGLSQKEVADHCKVSESTIWKNLEGIHNMSLSTYLGIIDLLGIKNNLKLKK